MSVIQTIRNKYIGLVVVLIIVALVGFLVMDALQSNISNMFRGDNTLLASINGTRVDYKKFEELRTQYEDNMKSRNQTGNLTEQERTQIQEQVWNDLVKETLFNEEIEKLGIGFSEKELQDMISGPNPDPMIRQSFTDPNTGVFDAAKVREYIGQIGQDKTGKAREQWRNFEKELIKNRIQTKYVDMLSKGFYVPKFMKDDMTVQRKSTASLNYVMVPYTAIDDSKITVSKEDIENYVKKRAKMFILQEDEAKVEYVSFDVLPAADDTNSSLGLLNKLRAEFDSTKDAVEFAAKHSEENQKSIYYTASTLKAADPNAVLGAAVGTVVGPFFADNAFKMMKVLDKKTMPDSVKASHILVSIGEKRNEEQAKAIIDSIEMMVKSGADFAQVAAARSDDESNKAKGGDLGYFAQGSMVPEFNDACFNGKKGDLKVVKTQFGYHLLRITDQKDFKPAVKIAVITKELVAGSATTNAIYSKASDFTSSAKDAKAFDDVAKKKNLEKRIADNITRTQSMVSGLGNARELARWAFTAKINDVSPIMNLDNKMVIAKLVSRSEKGTTRNLESLKPQLETEIKKEKKGKMLADQYKGKATLEEIATAAAQQVVAVDTLTLLGGGAQTEIANEPKVLGSAFNKANLNKVSPGIAGQNGVYFLKVNNQSIAKPEATHGIDVLTEAQQLQMQISNQAPNMIPYILKRKADIEDNRGSFY